MAITLCPRSVPLPVSIAPSPVGPDGQLTCPILRTGDNLRSIHACGTVDRLNVEQAALDRPTCVPPSRAEETTAERLLTVMPEDESSMQTPPRPPGAISRPAVPEMRVEDHASASRAKDQTSSGCGAVGFPLRPLGGAQTGENPARHV